ncbi:MAG TPA: 50S ribosomal protein L29 [Actinopolymorphaceae bacterium]|jgi:large subunit ribosomal protein L29
MPNQSKATDLRVQDDEALAQQLAEFKEELFNLRFQGATGQLESHGRLRLVKRDIARIYTVLRERELGITGQHSIAAVPGTTTQVGGAA